MVAPSNGARLCTMLSLNPPSGALVVAVLFSSSPVLAQTTQLRFQRLDSNDGLSHNSVYAITEDTEGFLWIGTADGLNRYDGYEFRVYRHDPDDTISLSNNLIHDLHTGPAGALWIATADGVSRFDPLRDSFVRYGVRSATSRRDAQEVFDLFEDAAGTLWAGTGSGLFRYDSAQDRFGLFLPVSGEAGETGVFAVQEDGDGRLWLLVGGGDSWELWRMGETERFERFSVSTAWRATLDFLIDVSGNFWVGVPGPALLDRDERRVLPPADAKNAPLAWEIHDDPDGTVWIGTDDGLYRADPDEGTITRHLLDPSRTALLFNFVRSLHRDRSGTLWVGTYGGLYRADPHAKPFGHLAGDPTNPNSLSSSVISSVYEDGGTLWIGTYGAGLNRLDRRDGTIRVYRHDPSDPTSLPNDQVLAIHGSSAGLLWIGTQAGLCRFDPSTQRFRRYELPVRPGQSAQPFVASIAEGPAGGLWLAPGYCARGAPRRCEGLYWFDPATGRARLYAVTGDETGPSGPRTESLLVQDSETVWIGMATGDLDKLDVPTGRFTHYPLVTEDGRTLESEGVRVMHQTADGTLWLGTGLGLSRFDPTTESFRHYFQQDGLPGSVVYSILEDGSGRLWLGTNAGLSRFDRRAPPGRQFRNFDTADGIGNTEFNRRAAFEGSRGEFFFGGMNGLTYFFPDEIRDNPYVPPIVLTRVETASRDGLRSHNPRGLEHLVLSYRDYALSFEFAALSFTNPERNRYAYRLEGLDKDWVDAGRRRFARYTNIPPGEYLLRVRGSNNDGVWNEGGVALPVTVRPPFWSTWWFRLTMILLVIAALVAAYRIRVARLLEIERLRLRIAGDLHDDLSSNLSGIALMGEMVQRTPEFGPRERKQISRITDTARAMVEDLRDIVWLVDPTHDRAEDLLLKMKDLASTLLNGIDYEFRSGAKGLSGRLSLHFRRQVFLIYKEVLHNIVRHAEASSVVIEVVEEDGRLVLRVSDDGVGFEIGASHSGFGLESLRRRVEALSGEIEMTSRPGAGTRVELWAPIT